MQTVAKVSSLTKYFGELEAVCSVNLTLKKGEIFGLIGPDGAGKSTLIRMIAGVLEPGSGDIQVKDVDVVKDYESARHKIGYMPQAFGLYGLLTVEENLRFVADIFGIRGDTYNERVSTLYSFSGLEPFKKRRTQNLSGGMKQKLGLSCVLMHMPDVLLLDEPTNGVDPVSRREFWDMLHSIAADGKTILISTPYMDEAQRCHKVAFMKEGKIFSLIDPARALSEFEYATFDITTDNPRRLLPALKKRGDFISVSLIGGCIHIISEKGSPASVSLEKTVREVTDGDAVLSQVPPTMQDVYFLLSGER